MRIGLFGGTFNPPHNAHLKIAEAFLKQFELDKLYICPANISYHKSNVLAVDAYHRLNMCKLAFDALPKDKVIISDMEILRGGNTYTVDTVNEILSLNPECEKVFVLCGTDMIKTLPRWYKADELFEKSYFVHAGRDGAENISLSGAQIYPLDIKRMDLSSTKIRLDVSRSKSSLSSQVYNYIKGNLLYLEDKEYDLDDLRKYAKDHEKESRYNHTLAVAKCALEIKNHVAPHLSDNIVSAAALLHDCTKNCDIYEHHALFSTLEKPLNDEDLSNEKLFHARSGAILAKRLFDVSKAVYNAIWRHTVGAANMTVLDKIIFLADYIEETRTYEECIALRNAYYEGAYNANSLILRLINLNKCVRIALDATVNELLLKGATPHRETLEAIQSIKTETDEYEKIFGNI